MRVMLIRHGEKPSHPRKPPFGVDAKGNRDFESLAVRGWQRAGALVALLAPAHGRLLWDPDLARPDLVYAANPSPVGHAGGRPSQRPWQTIAPLAAALGLTPNLTHAKGEELALTEEVLGRRGNVLISWSHEALPAIARLIATSAPTPPPMIPASWPDERYDLVWVLTAPEASGRWGFAQVSQLLLAGDTATHI